MRMDSPRSSAFFLVFVSFFLAQSGGLSFSVYNAEAAGSSAGRPRFFSRGGEEGHSVFAPFVLY